MRHPQTRNWSPDNQLKIRTAEFARKNPAGAPNCGQEAMKPRCLLVRAHSIASSTEPPPSPRPIPNALDQTDECQQNGAPDADASITGHRAPNGNGRESLLSAG